MKQIPDKNDQNAMKTMFNHIAKNYDFLNNVMTFFTQKRIKSDAINRLKSDHKRIIDVCTGTGDIAIILSKKYPKSDITAIDFSPEMLKIAHKKSSRQNINFFEANAMSMPFHDNSFDLCTISFGLRNLPDKTLALKEIFRILEKDGELLIIDLGKPKAKWVYPLILDKIIPILGKIFNGNKIPYKYLVESQKDYPSQQEVSKLLQAEGFVEIRNKDFLFGSISSIIARKP